MSHTHYPLNTTHYLKQRFILVYVWICERNIIGKRYVSVKGQVLAIYIFNYNLPTNVKNTGIWQNII